jgi:hypothetical protein
MVATDDAERPPSVTVIVAVPLLRANSQPFLRIEATKSLLELHVAVLETNAINPSSNIVRRMESPTVKLSAAGVRLNGRTMSSAFTGDRHDKSPVTTTAIASTSDVTQMSKQDALLKHRRSVGMRVYLLRQRRKAVVKDVRLMMATVLRLA